MTASPNRILGIAFGAGFVLVGALGFTVTAGVEPFASQGALLFGLLQVNPLQNVVHVLIGAALLVAGLRGVRAARTANAVVGTAVLVLGLAGLFLVGTNVNILALNVADNALHFASAATLLAAGLGADKRIEA